MVTVADDFSMGARVELHGLKGAAEHNGKHGTVTGLQNERLKVRLDASGGQTLALKPANLARETAPDRDEADRLKTESTNALLKLSETLQRVGTSREAMVAAFAAESASVDDIGAGFDRALQFYGPGVSGADAEARAHLLASKASALLMSVAGREGLPESLRVARDALGLSHEAYKLSPTKMGAFSIARCAANVGADLGVNGLQAALDPLYDMFADSAGEPLGKREAHDRYLRSCLLSLLFRAQWKGLGGKCQFAGPGEVGTMLMPVLGGPDAVELLDAREFYARAAEGAARDRVAARVAAAQSAIDARLPPDKVEPWPPLDDVPPCAPGGDGAEQRRAVAEQRGVPRGAAGSGWVRLCDPDWEKYFYRGDPSLPSIKYVVEPHD